MASGASAMEGASQAARKVLGSWTRPQMALAIGLAATVLAVGGLWLFLSPSRGYAPLFTQLQPTDAAAVVSQLDAQNEPYKLDDQGGTVLVPEADVYRLRLALASQGLPSDGTVGFEIMDSLGLASTDFDRQVALLRATQGELERTIDEIDGVKSSRVHLVMPKDTALGSDAQPATAAALVEMQPGKTLSAKTVQGIVHLISASVPDLQPDQVTVLDATGKVLSTPAAMNGSEDLASVGSNLALQTKFQQDLQTRLESFLTQIFGPGNVATQVAATLNFDQSTTNTDMFASPDGGDPQAGLLRSVQELQTSMAGTSGGTGGTPGDTNFPTYPAVTSGTQNSNSTETQSTRNYELNETKTTTQLAPGTVNQLQVSVVVSKPLTAQQQAQVKDIVSAAVGADPARKDVITVQSMPFDTTLLDSLGNADSGEAAPAKAIPVWAYAAAGALAAALLGLLLMMLLRRRGRLLEEAYVDDDALDLLRARQMMDEASIAGAGAVEQDVVLTDVKKHARSRPDLVARTLRAWMAEE